MYILTILSKINVLFFYFSYSIITIFQVRLTSISVQLIFATLRKWPIHIIRSVSCWSLEALVIFQLVTLWHRRLPWFLVFICILYCILRLRTVCYGPCQIFLSFVALLKFIFFRCATYLIWVRGCRSFIGRFIRCPWRAYTLLPIKCVFYSKDILPFSIYKIICLIFFPHYCLSSIFRCHNCSSSIYYRYILL